jgi:hypothetical protein
VLEKTLRRSLWSVAVLTVLCSAAWPKVPVMKELPITVSVHNDVGIPLGILLHAESEASRIFRESGLEIRWLNCSPAPAPPENLQNSLNSRDPGQCTTADFPSHLQLRIAKHSLNLNEFAMGISYLSADGIGCNADLFYDRAKAINETSRVNVSTILGHGIAHELGHLLLGTNSHAPMGLMRARWQPADLARASQGHLLFSPLESLEMRNKLALSHAQARADSHIVTARLGD